MAASPAEAPLDPRPRALVDLAIALTREPWSDVSPGLERLRAHGLDDRALHDAVNVIAYFNFVNRVAIGLGVELER